MPTSPSLAILPVEELQKTLTSTEAANGFANRILWVCVRRHGRLPEGGSVDAAALHGSPPRAQWAVRQGPSGHRNEA